MNDARLQASRASLSLLFARAVRGLSLRPIKLECFAKPCRRVTPENRPKSRTDSVQQFDRRWVGAKQFELGAGGDRIEITAFEHALQWAHEPLGGGDLRSRRPRLRLVVQCRKRLSRRKKTIKTLMKRHFAFHGVMDEVMDEQTSRFEIRFFARTVGAHDSEKMAVGIDAGHQDTHDGRRSTQLSRRTMSVAIAVDKNLCWSAAS